VRVTSSVQLVRGKADHLKRKRRQASSPPRVTVTVGSSTRINMNSREEEEEVEEVEGGLDGTYSLPNLSLLRAEARARRPHMGTSRLVTPPKPPRRTTPTRSVERPKISTVLLPTYSNNVNTNNTNNTMSTTDNTNSMDQSSFTAVSSLSSSTFLVRHSNPWREEVLRMGVPKVTLVRHGRGSSCTSEESSGVSSCCSADCASQVTVNGQHHCASTAIFDSFQMKRKTDVNMVDSLTKTDSANMSGCTECNDTLSTCSRCEPLLHV